MGLDFGHGLEIKAMIMAVNPLRDSPFPLGGLLSFGLVAFWRSWGRCVFLVVWFTTLPFRGQWRTLEERVLPYMTSEQKGGGAPYRKNIYSIYRLVRGTWDWNKFAVYAIHAVNDRSNRPWPRDFCPFTPRYNRFFALYPIKFTVGRSGHPKTHPLTDFAPYPIAV